MIMLMALINNCNENRDSSIICVCILDPARVIRMCATMGNLL